VIASFLFPLSSFLSVACSNEPPSFDRGNDQVQAHYDKKTGRLATITYDANRNGRIDTWTYMDGPIVVRVEIDRDEDGKIDRWEYYRPDNTIEKVAWSRANNGRPDTWAWQDAAGQIARIDYASLAPAPVTSEAPTSPKAQGLRPKAFENPTAQGPEPKAPSSPKAEGPKPKATENSAAIVRTEFFANGTLTRAEEDSNLDGRIDKWETWQAGAIAEVRLDTTGSGVPDRLLVYRPDGSVRAESLPRPSATAPPR
jgi:hypothetical protein